MSLTGAATLCSHRLLTVWLTRLRMFEYHAAVCVIIIICVQSAVVERRTARRRNLL